MAFHDVSPIISMKRPHLDNDFIKFSLEESLTPKLSNLTLRNMATALTPKPLTLPSGLTEKCITQEYCDRAIEFLRKNFFRDEPLNVAVNLISGPDETCQELEDYCKETINDGLSTIVLNSEGEIVAAGLFGIFSRDDVIEDHSESCSNPKFKKILKLLHKIGEESDIFGKCPDLDATLDVKIISVDESCRGQGLGHYLLHKAIEIARSNNIKAIRSECSSVFTAKIMHKLGATKIYGLEYNDYRYNGRPIFNTPPPHDKITVYYYRV